MKETRIAGAVFKSEQVLVGIAILLAVLTYTTPAGADPVAEQKQLLWGDTHLHTYYSFDAYLNGNYTIGPDEAYRYAKGQPVIHAYNRTRVQIQTPLDFLVVSDHAEFLGGIRDVYNEGVQDPSAPFWRKLVYWYTEWQIRDAIDSGTGREYFSNIMPLSQDVREAARTWAEAVGSSFPGSAISQRSAWKSITETSDAHNEPGKFTALIGWEWSSNPGGGNLHRIVITDASAAQAMQILPFASSDSPYPEDLWDWMGKASDQIGARFLSIPHNSNISKGQMFSDQTLRGESIEAEYATARKRWEPIVEITQIKGDSETHPSLSPNDEFADFEPYPFYIQRAPAPYKPESGDYIRSALKTGLSLGSKTGVNPYEFGFIGSTDSHTGVSSAEEPNFWGKMAYDSIPENKANSRIINGSSGWSMSASGLAAVWAEENTRSAILDAFERREVYATTGPRIKVRLFAGWDFTAEDLNAGSFFQNGRSDGVPMGGELTAPADARAPRFMVAALKDPLSGNLDRVQMIKGWLAEDGSTREHVYNVAWSGDRQLNADGRLASVGDSVDRKSGRYSNDIGTDQLQALWIDPDFDPGVPAFYYVRVLEIPTPRHALLDAIALGLEEPTEGPSVIQERAYTSPIWYKP
jgi:hypothetical protein